MHNWWRRSSLAPLLCAQWRQKCETRHQSSRSQQPVTRISSDADALSPQQPSAVYVLAMHAGSQLAACCCWRCSRWPLKLVDLAPRRHLERRALWAWQVWVSGIVIRTCRRDGPDNWYSVPVPVGVDGCDNGGRQTPGRIQLEHERESWPGPSRTMLHLERDWWDQGVVSRANHPRHRPISCWLLACYCRLPPDTDPLPGRRLWLPPLDAVTLFLAHRLTTALVLVLSALCAPLGGIAVGTAYLPSIAPSLECLVARASRPGDTIFLLYHRVSPSPPHSFVHSSLRLYPRVLSTGFVLLSYTASRFAFS